jgi:hypothetical protein
LTQIYTSLSADLAAPGLKKRASKSTADAASYIVVMTSAGTVYQPCHVASPTAGFVAVTPASRPLTLPGTNVPLPLQPLASCLPASASSGLLSTSSMSTSSMSTSSLSTSSLSTSLLSASLPSLDLLCSTIDESTLDDIEQVLKDAENFDILA